MEDRFSFSFDLDQIVITLFGDKGLVGMLGFDDGGRKYYVQTATTSNWFKECQLKECQLKECQLRGGGMDYVANFIKAACEEQDSECSVPSVDLYSAFVKYFSGNGFPVISQKNFSRRLATLGYQRMKKNGLCYWLGLSLAGDA